MTIKLALAGNPNSGKTTLFNSLTGSNQYVGNWPGVTVEKKEGSLKGSPHIIVQDLPGIYSLSPYTPEEVVARTYLIKERPEGILNIVDGTNIERNLYLTTQLLELGLPVVVAVNMIDLVRKRGDRIDLDKLSAQLRCPVVEMSALKGEGGMEAAHRLVQLIYTHQPNQHPHIFSSSVEHIIAHIEESIDGKIDSGCLRWYAIKLFERDERVRQQMMLDDELTQHLEQHIVACERELDDDAESIITNQRYTYISSIVAQSVRKRNGRYHLSVSDKIDNVVTHRLLALPIFVLVMFLVYYISLSTVGGMASDWTNEVLFGDIITPAVRFWLEGINCAPWLTGLIVDGIIAGVGAVLGFVPQMLILFLMLSILEDVGYMSRIAFILDRLFRKFGLSGKSFIPMLVSSGCGVPGVMATRTIENERDRRMTIMTTCFIPCGAKMPFIALFSGALFNNSGLIAVSAYFIGVAAVVISGLMLKKTRPFAGRPSPFVMELPPYHIPSAGNILRTTWDRGWSFIQRAGTVILAASIVLWFLQAFGWVNGTVRLVADNNNSLLSLFGSAASLLFAPLGFGFWQATVATFSGLLAKEAVVGSFGVLYGFAAVAENGAEYWGLLAQDFSQLSAYSFMIFNLLCAPCFAAIGAIRQEMNSAKWTWAALGYMTGFAYAISLIVYQLGLLLNGGSYTVGSLAALAVLALLFYLLLRPVNKEVKG